MKNLANVIVAASTVSLLALAVIGVIALFDLVL